MLLNFRKYSTFFLLLIISLPNFSFAQQNTPELGDPFSSILSLKNEEIIGISSYQRLQKFNAIDNNPLVSSYINYLGNLLSRNLLDNKRRYNFFVVNSSQINAFAIPGGFIGINSGLILLTENEAQLASVVAHEISHIKLRHTAEMIANSRRNTIPIWIGIFAGMFSGNPQASIAALQTGFGISAQQNINLIRSNEVEADTLGFQILDNANFDASEMSKLFQLMQSAKGDVQKNLAYLSTHPMFDERISNTENRLENSRGKLLNSTDDYFYIKNLLEVSQVIDINNAINQLNNKDSISRHKLSLLYQKKSDFKKSIDVLKYDKGNIADNIYLAFAYIDGLLGQGEVEEAISTINNLINIKPLNKILPLKLAEIYVDHKKGTVSIIENIKTHDDFFKLNPNYHRIMSKLFMDTNKKYESSIHLADYYVLMDNARLAIDVLENSSKSSEITSSDSEKLTARKIEILCKYTRPLEPIFGEKTCN